MCGDRSLDITMIDLGQSPVANALVDPGLATPEDARFPLKALVCSHCFLVQIEDFVPANDLFRHYLYFSSYSQSWLAHVRAFANRATSELGLGKESLVLEVASNDGHLLKEFQELGVGTLGIDPSENVSAVAIDQGVKTIPEFFTLGLAQQLGESGIQADLIVANNVLGHVVDVHDFMEGLRTVLGPDGVVTVEVPHLQKMLELLAFDTIYHEHRSYLSLFILEQLTAAHGLTIVGLDHLTTHGGSIRVWLRHTRPSLSPAVSLNEAIQQEVSLGLRTPTPYLDFSARAERCRDQFKGYLDQAEASGRNVAGYGAAAKGTTFLNYCGAGPTSLTGVADLNPHKQGKLLPGCRIPVIDPDTLYGLAPDDVLILPWNLRDEIALQLRHAWPERPPRYLTAVPDLDEFA